MMRTALAVVALPLLFVGVARAGERNLVDLHKNAGHLASKECLSCHAEIAKGVSLNKKIKTFHRVHLESKKDTPKQCSECHESVDLRDGSAAALRKQVSPDVCKACHDGGVSGAKVLFAK